MENRIIKALLVEDDEDDYVILRNVLNEIDYCSFDLEWVADHRTALEKARYNNHDICFMDYLLGELNGFQLMESFIRNGFSAPIIMLTGMGSYEMDFEAMKRGAADYLEKSRLTPDIVERSIRYALERAKTIAELQKSERQLRILSAKLIESQENERRLVARDLHDSIGSSLAAINFALETKLSNMKATGLDRGEISLEQIISMVRSTIDETRRISSNLRPSTLDNMGLIITTNSLCREFSKLYSGIQIEKKINLEEEDIPEIIKIVIYRIMQEALNNIAKHSNADYVKISMEGKNNFLKISIEDNGCGFEIQEMAGAKGNKQGMGIIGMKERTELSGGCFEISARKEKGTTIDISWPLKIDDI